MKTLLSIVALFSTSCYLLAIDMNNNGMSDLFEAQNSSAFDASDFDGDGSTQTQEIIAGTDPENSNDFLHIQEINYNPNTGDATVSWNSKAGKTYNVVTTTNAGSSATPVYTSPDILGLGGLQKYTVNSAALNLGVDSANPLDRIFFRIGVRDSNEDSDGDGVSNSEELLLGFDPADANSVRSAAGGGDYQQLVNLLQGANPNGNAFGMETPGIPSEEHASRFLAQATFGPSDDRIAALRTFGANAYEKWIDDQLTKTPTNLLPYIEYLESIRTTVNGKDELRQRLAWSLYQIMPISREGGGLATLSEAIASYYDLMIDGAFESYADLLHNVSRNAAMGQYLTHIGNAKADVANNVYPDENFAREIMQLFTIGLWELNIDGTRKLDASGNPIPTYNNADITELARVFTGQWYKGLPWGYSNVSLIRFRMGEPMQMHQFHHDSGSKILLDGWINLPAGQTGEADIESVCQRLAAHPNTGPFLATRLIQALVTSNPSPDYVQRVAEAYYTSNYNLGQTAKAVLLDQEARGVEFLLNSEFGKLRAPMLRTLLLARAFKAGEAYDPAIVGNQLESIQWWDPKGTDFSTTTLQYPFYPPSIFNYFEPGYSHPGEIRDRGMLSPEFQIHTASASIYTIRFLQEYMQETPFHAKRYGAPLYRVDLSEVQSLASTQSYSKINDLMNLYLCHGTMGHQTYAELLLRQNNNRILGATKRLAGAIVIAAPDSAVIR